MTEALPDKLPRTLRVAIVHRLAKPDWTWVLPKSRYAANLDISTFQLPLPQLSKSKLEIVGSALGGAAVWRAHAAKPFDTILSFRPGTAAWLETARLGRKGRHDLFGFNLTDLPSGARRARMAKALKGLHQGFCFTRMETGLYAEHFSLPSEMLSVVPWGVSAPVFTEKAPVEGRYISALGGEARDYGTIAEAARRLPGERFVIVARPKNLEGLSFPDNVTVFTNLPKEEAWGVVAHSDLHILSLRSRSTPCGIVTLVGAMHIGRPQTITEAAGVLEYTQNGKLALSFEAGSVDGLVATIERLKREEGLAERLSRLSKVEAAQRHSEETTIRFADTYLAAIARDPEARLPDFEPAA
ncbi:MAG: hypothetical protein V2I43_06830 [Parvularcula sp.]|jgi:glycosyltransferase involved in cell wall biosynthesis|nr:hypothetical protein [Parvularcula sp.]